MNPFYPDGVREGDMEKMYREKFNTVTSPPEGQISERERLNRCDIVGIVSACIDPSIVLLFIRALANATIQLFPQDLIRLIVLTYYAIVPPLMECNRNQVAVIRGTRLLIGESRPNSRSDSTAYGPDGGLGPRPLCDGEVLAVGDMPSCLQKRAALRSFTTHSRVTALACGNDFMIATGKYGYYAWGSNDHGCLGRGLLCEYPDPIWVNVGARIVMIACGTWHVMMIVEIENRVENRVENRIENSSSSKRIRTCSTRLYGWGCIEGLGLKYAHPRLPAESEFYNSPQQVALDNPEAVSCGNDYSLVLAGGIVYLCQDDGEYATPGLGPRKLGFSMITRMFACCHRYVIWAGSDTIEDHRLGVSEISGVLDIDRASQPEAFELMQCQDLSARPKDPYHGSVGDEDYCGLNNRYTADGDHDGAGLGPRPLNNDLWVHPAIIADKPARGVLDVLKWPPTACWVETKLSKCKTLSTCGPVVRIVGGRLTVLLMTAEEIYLLGRKSVLQLIYEW